MKTITKYQAVDGSEWNTKQQALDRDVLCERVKSIMHDWPKVNDEDCSFINGHGFIQLSEEFVMKKRTALLKLIAKHIDHKWVQQSLDDPGIHPSWVERVLSDSDLKPIYVAWLNLGCIDKRWRQWGQPYYAKNPDEGDQICVGRISS
jgi:hypothetical protein